MKRSLHDSSLTLNSRNIPSVSHKRSKRWSLGTLTSLFILILLIILIPIFLFKCFIHIPQKNGILASKWFHVRKEVIKEVKIATVAPPRSQQPVRPQDNPPQSYQSDQLESNIEQEAVIKRIEDTLRSHPLSHLSRNQTDHFLLEDYFVYLSSQPQCRNLPVITSMANIFSELYWQLIENFVYSMVKFGLSSCAMMICVSDINCMKRCEKSYFPCVLFDFLKIHPEKELPSPLEQIAELKLYHLPKALNKGVNIIILDSDVGFLSTPKNLIDLINPKIDMYVQKDIAYVMNRTKAGWKQWYTVPLPNIGIFYIKGNQKTWSIFNEAWRRYQDVDPKRRNNPGKDQNQVAFAMKTASMTGRLQWAFFPSSSAVLLDMVYKFNDPRYELGGLAALSILQPSNRTNALSQRHKMGEATKDVGQVHDAVQAVHTTCYEQKNKVNGLKSANAFWNPYYYNVTRRTLTKKIIYITPEQVRNEIRTLFYLGYITNRSIIIPNLLSHPNIMHKSLDLYSNQSLWPFFRVVYYKPSFYKQLKPSLSIIEPAYYWRIERDYFMNKSHLIPKPFLLPVYNHENSQNYYMSGEKDHQKLQQALKSTLTIRSLEQQLLSPRIQGISRVVLTVLPSILSEQEERQELRENEKRDERRRDVLQHHYDWAMDSVGRFLPYDQEIKEYEVLPKLNQPIPSQDREDPILSYYAPEVARIMIQDIRLCDTLFQFDGGNRSCFNKCK